MINGVTVSLANDMLVPTFKPDGRTKAPHTGLRDARVEAIIIVTLIKELAEDYRAELPEYERRMGSAGSA